MTRPDPSTYITKANLLDLDAREFGDAVEVDLRYVAILVRGLVAANGLLLDIAYDDPYIVDPNAQTLVDQEWALAHIAQALDLYADGYEEWAFDKVGVAKERKRSMLAEVDAGLRIVVANPDPFIDYYVKQARRFSRDAVMLRRLAREARRAGGEEAGNVES